MTQIKIEVPANDTIALSALGKALQLIAAERTPPTVSGVELPTMTQEQCERYSNHLDKVEKMREDVVRTSVKMERNDTCGAHTDPYANVELPEVTETDVKFENTTTEQEHNDNMRADAEADDTLDDDGLPWDKRIHSRGKSRLADNTWRLARKPADKSQDEWNEYVETIKAELKAVQSIAPPEADDQPAATVEDITQAEVDAGNLPPVPTQEDRDDAAKEFDEAVLPPVETVAPPVVETPPVETVAPPVVDTPPVEAPSNAPSVTTFPELMKWITSVAKKRGADNDMIKAVLADIDPALTGLPLLATRADLIPTFVTKLEERLA